MLHAEAIDRIEEQISEAVSHGARVLCGGRRRLDLGASYFEPTVIANIDPALHANLGLLQQETFGPILTIVVVDNAEQAIALANDSAFGLSASVWTRNIRQGRAIAGRLHAGAVMINDVGSYFGISEAPHGGRGSSGWGRTHSQIGLMEMVQVKYVDVDRWSRWRKPWWFAYSSDLGECAAGFTDFLYAPKLLDRWRGAVSAVRHLVRARVADSRARGSR